MADFGYVKAVALYMHTGFFSVMINIPHFFEKGRKLPNEEKQTGQTFPAL